MANGQPRPAFYVAVLLVVMGLVGLALWRYGALKPGGPGSPGSRDFKVELVLIDDPVAMRDAYAAGNLHVGWATLDMIPLFLEGLRKDSRVMPRVYQQVDWSNGGDGIVVRDTVKTMADVRGKTIVLAQNSPSHYFVLNALINAGVQPAEVDFKFTQDAFQAAAAFNADKRLAGVVSWAPDIYNLEKVKGNKVLVTTSTANKLIADVWFARADFAKDNPDIMEGITRGIFDAMVELKDQGAKQKVAKLMAAGYSIPESDAVGIHFFPNSWDLNKKITRNADGKEVEELYDPNVAFVVEEVGKLAGQFGAARIVIEDTRTDR